MENTSVVRWLRRISLACALLAGACFTSEVYARPGQCDQALKDYQQSRQDIAASIKTCRARQERVITAIEGHRSQIAKGTYSLFFNRSGISAFDVADHQRQLDWDNGLLIATCSSISRFKDQLAKLKKPRCEPKPKPDKTITEAGKKSLEQYLRQFRLITRYAGRAVRRFADADLRAVRNLKKFHNDVLPPVAAGGPVPDPELNNPLEVFQELSVQTGALDAGFVGGIGGMINVVTKSGGNKFDGSKSVYLDRDDPGWSKPEWPYELGGYITKDKKFFFFSSDTQDEIKVKIPAGTPRSGIARIWKPQVFRFSGRNYTFADRDMNSLFKDEIDDDYQGFGIDLTKRLGHKPVFNAHFIWSDFVFDNSRLASTDYIKPKPLRGLTTRKPGIILVNEPDGKPRAGRSPKVSGGGGPRINIIAGPSVFLMDGPVFGVTDLGADNSPLAGDKKTTLKGGTLDVDIQDVELGSRWTFGFGGGAAFGRDRSSDSVLFPGLVNSVLFPVTGGGAIGVLDPVVSNTKSKFHKFTGHAELTMWHHRSPDSHLGFYGQTNLEYSRFNSNTDVSALNAAFGGPLEHSYDVTRSQISWTNRLGITGRRRLSDGLWMSGRAWAGLSFGNTMLKASSCLDRFAAAGCDGVFSTASTSSNKGFVQPEFGVTAALTALFACSGKARLTGACILMSLEGGYLNAPFAKTTQVMALGGTMGLTSGRMQQLHAKLKIAVPLSTILTNAGSH